MVLSEKDEDELQKRRPRLDETITAINLLPSLPHVLPPGTQASIRHTYQSNPQDAATILLNEYIKLARDLKPLIRAVNKSFPSYKDYWNEMLPEDQRNETSNQAPTQPKQGASGGSGVSSDTSSSSHPAAKITRQKAVDVLESKPVTKLFVSQVDPKDLVQRLTKWFLPQSDIDGILAPFRQDGNKTLAASNLLDVLTTHYKNRDDINLQDLIEALEEVDKMKHKDLVTAILKECC